MPHEVIISPRARRDLLDLYLYVAEQASERIALAYAERVETFFERLGVFPARGHRRDDLSLGMRTLGFERRLTIAFHVEPGRVVVDRIFAAGRDIDAEFSAD